MEADTLKKILLYSAVAVVLGLLLTLVPLIALTGIKAENRYATPQSLSERLKALEGAYGTDTPKYSVADLEISAISFVIALVAYASFKRKMSYR